MKNKILYVIMFSMLVLINPAITKAKLFCVSATDDTQARLEACQALVDKINKEIEEAHKNNITIVLPTIEPSQHPQDFPTTVPQPLSPSDPNYIPPIPEVIEEDPLPTNNLPDPNTFGPTPFVPEKVPVFKVNLNFSTSFSSPGFVTGGTVKKEESVKVMQDFLVRKGYYQDITGESNQVDGKYGPRTIEAVKEFQRQHGLVVDGIFGPKSRAAAELENTD